MTDTLLEVQDLTVDFHTHGGTVEAVRGISFSVARGETLAIVGESGCGKSVSMQALLGLIPMPPGVIRRGSAQLLDTALLPPRPATLNAVRGQRVGMIFQDPMSALNPTMRIGDQIAETLRIHQGLSRSAAAQRAVALLEEVRIPEAATRARQYPFEFSGGMLQRAMIAMAIACGPELLIADEPTTALDVTIQAQILDLLRKLQEEKGMAIILITHDLGVVAQMAHRVAVMYAGEIVETAAVETLFAHSAHPYTQGLRRATPSNQPGAAQVLTPIEGSPPDLFAPPKGCAYAARCPQAMALCTREAPPEFSPSPAHAARCWRLHPQAPAQDTAHG
jgi:oligopeptide/dipeptide ABC transporter ATP-binding protein